jgi:hypothetical protein
MTTKRIGQSVLFETRRAGVAWRLRMRSAGQNSRPQLARSSPRSASIHCTVASVPETFTTTR